MTLLNAPAFDARAERRNRIIIIASSVTFAVLLVLFVAGFLLGHGWLFTNIPTEHKVGRFFDALEAKDYSKAFGMYNNDPNWQQHPEKYADYPLARFTEDWTTESPVKAPITSHHIDISKTDGTGFWGTGVIVAARVNLQDGIPRPRAGEDPATKPGHKVFMYVNKKDGTMTWPAPHEIGYE